ncbi:MAG: gluconate 2-dehydrogenase subunit 3 family protein [Bryobacterales bacterium]|nr:gluconate 2-dehydrogenase subunit 3 family protein [Bryobacterales bacterium]
MSSRRETLKILGAIGTTCIFPFPAEELYGQHASHTETPLSAPRFFRPGEMEQLATLADLFIPPTDTPGGAAAGVPLYVDLVVSRDAGYRKLFRAGLKDLNKLARRQHGTAFHTLGEARQVALLEPLVAEADQLRTPDFDRASRAVRFARVLKNLIADGYYTSRAGLVEELGYSGNSAHAEFPGAVHEH